MDKLKYLIVLLVLLSGCSKSYDAIEAEFGATRGFLDKKELLSEDIDGRSTPQAIDRKIIKEGWLSYEVESLKESKKRIVLLVNKYGGYIASDSEHRSGYRTSNTLKIKIPSENFDTLIEELASDAKYMESKSISLRDVTEEYLDVESRLKNKKALEARYLEILQKANSVEEILAVEKEIGKIREEIDSTEGRLNYLKHMVSLSTIDLTIYEVEYIDGGGDNRVVESLKGGWDSLISFLLFLINIWPLLILICAGVFIFKRFRKRKSEKVKV